MHNRKIKICFVIDSLAIGGANILTLEVMKLLNKEKFDISLIPLFYVEEIKSIRSRIPGYINYECLYFESRLNTKNLLKLYRKLKPFDIVHSALDNANLYCSVTNLLFLRRKKFYATIHGPDAIYTNDENFKRILFLKYTWKFRIIFKYFQNILFKFYDKIIAVCVDTKHFLMAKRHIANSKIIPIYHGLSLEQLENYTSDKLMNLSTEKFIVAYVGRLAYGKGLESFIPLISSIIHEQKDIFLLVIGCGDLNNFLSENVKKYKINENFKNMAFTKNHVSLYNQIDLLILPSTSEGIPLVLLEAMYFKTLVLASNVGGIPELITDGENGFMYNLNDNAELKRKILYVKDNIQNMFSIKEAARTTIINKFDLRKNITNIEKVLLG